MSTRSRLLAGKRALWSPYRFSRARMPGWWCADDETSMELMVTDDPGGHVSSWKSRTSTIAVTGTTTQRPTWTVAGWQDLVPGVAFDGAATGLLATGFSPPIPTGANYSTIVVVADPGALVSTPDNFTAVSIGGGGSGTSRMIGRTSAGAITAGVVPAGSSNAMQVTGSGVWDTPSIVVAEFAASVKLWQDGTLLGTSSGAAMSTSTTRLRLGANTASAINRVWAGSLRHVFIFAGVLTTAERELLEGWCAWDAGLQANLPDSHPYKHADRTFQLTFYTGGVPEGEEPPEDTEDLMATLAIQPRTQQWLDRLTDPLPMPDEQAWNVFFYRLTQYNLWDKIAELMPWTTENNLEGLKGVIRGSNLTVDGAVTFLQPFGVFGGVLDEELQEYINTDGVIQSDLRMIDLPGVAYNNWGFFVGCTSNYGTDGGDIGFFSGSQQAGQLITGNGFRARFYAPTAVSFGNLNPEGLSIGQTTSSTTGFAMNGEGNVVIYADTASELPTSSNSTLSFLKGGKTLNSFSARRQLIAGVSVGFNQTDAEHLRVAYDELLVNLDIFDQVQSTPYDPDAPGWFTKDDINSVTPADLTVCNIIGFPQTNDTNNDVYNGYPCTDTISRPWGSQATSTFVPPRDGVFWGVAWDDREHDEGLKPNGLAPGPKPVAPRTVPYIMALGADTLGMTAGTPIRMDFDSSEKAIAACWARMAQSCGYDERDDPDDPDGMGYLDYAEYGGLLAADVMPWLDFYDVRDSKVVGAFNGYAVAENICVLDPGRLADLTQFPNRGVSLDLESHNHRDRLANFATDTTSNLFIKQVLWGARIAHAKGFKFKFQANVLTTGGSASGVSVNTAPAIMQSADVDRFTIVGVHDSVRYPQGIIALLDEQIDLARGGSGSEPIDWSKVEVAIGLGAGANKFRVSEALLVREWMADNSVKHLTIQKGGSPLGQDISYNWNKVIAALTGLPTS